MSNSRIAHRYAKSLLSLALENNTFDQVKDDVAYLKKILDENRDLKLLLKSPVVKQDKKYKILSQIFSTNISELTLQFIKLVCRKGREIELYQITLEVEKLSNEHLGIQPALLKTAFPIEPVLRKKFETIVKEVSGKTPQLKEIVDPKLIGGFVLTVGDNQIDDTISNKLKRLKRELVH